MFSADDVRHMERALTIAERGRYSTHPNPRVGCVLVSGNYARSLGINKIGLRRKGFSAEAIDAVARAYKLLVRRRGRRDDALEQLEALAQQFDEVKQFRDFILASSRGIVK